MRIGIGLGLGQGSPSGAAADLSGLYADFNWEAANVLKDGSNLVGQVTDLGANGYSLTQATGVNKPLWVDNGAGTKDIGRFQIAGTVIQRLLRTGLPVDSALGWTALVVAKIDVAGSAANSYSLLAHAQNSNGRGGFQLEYFANTRDRRLVTRKVSDGTIFAVTFGQATLAAWEVWTVRVAGATADATPSALSIRVNGVETAYTGTPWFAAPSAAAPNLIIGTGNGTGNPDFSMGPCRIWKRYLDDTSIRAAEILAVGADYGITIP